MTQNGYGRRTSAGGTTDAAGSGGGGSDACGAWVSAGTGSGGRVAPSGAADDAAAGRASSPEGDASRRGVAPSSFPHPPTLAAVPPVFPPPISSRLPPSG